MSPSSAVASRTADGASVLPRLLYIGDVPVESTYHGSALLYRLLDEYPSNRLRIIEASLSPSKPARRLRNVEYRTLVRPMERLHRTRLWRWSSTWLTFGAGLLGPSLSRHARDFDPEAVLTVAHGYSWLAAAKFARQKRIPLYLFVHDHWPTGTPVFTRFQSKLEPMFARIYQQAAARYCVSPFMAQEYRRRYGVSGTVMYPMRAKDADICEPGMPKPPKTSGPLVGAYAGNIFGADYAELLGDVAAALDERGGRLLLFGPQSERALEDFGVRAPNIDPQGLLPWQELVKRLRNEADFLVVPMSFDAEDPDRASFAFPSKIADYTSTGLPLVIYGPESCSAVRWAREFSPVAEVVTSRGKDYVSASLRRLECANHREALGGAAQEIGNRLFSYRSVVDTFYNTLLSQ